MKFIIGLLLSFGILFSNDLKVGNTLDFTLEDQFEKRYSLTNDIKKLIFVFSKDNGHKLKDYLSSKDPEFLKSKNTLYMADISAMPSIIYSLFAKGDMQDLPYKVIMIHDDKDSVKYKTKENQDKFVVVTLDNKKITKIIKVDTVKDTIKELDK